MTNLVIFTSQTCDHQVPARCAPSSPVPHREHSAWRRHLCLLIGVRVPRQSRAGMPGLAAALAVLAPFPLRGLPLLLPPGLAPLPRPDAGPSTAGYQSSCCPTRAGASSSATLSSKPPVPLRLSLQLGPQQRILGVPGLDHGPQPGDQGTLIPAARYPRLTGHKPRSCSTPAKVQAPRLRVASRLQAHFKPPDDTISRWPARRPWTTARSWPSPRLRQTAAASSSALSRAVAVMVMVMVIDSRQKVSHSGMRLA